MLTLKLPLFIQPPDEMGMTNLLLVIPNDELECVGGEFCEGGVRILL